MIPLRARPEGTPLIAGRQVSAELEFKSGPKGTYLATQLTPHPFHITRPFRIAGDPHGMATLYLQSSSGGLYGDDDLSLSIRVGKGASAHVTTQASTVVHHARGGVSRMGVDIEAGEGALVEYLPDPSILFAGAHLEARTVLRLRPGARAILCDAVLTHDPHGQGDPFDRLSGETTVIGPQGPLLADRFDVHGPDWAARTGPWPCHATLTVAGDGAAGAVCAIRDALTDLPELWAGASAFADRDIAVARILAANGVSLTDALDRAWVAARTALTGAPPRLRKK
ncbi:MAG: urease accessory protein UreD [Pseudomonadota bacterium]